MKILISLLTLFLTGCMVGPNYCVPKVKTPKKFQEEKATRSFGKKVSLINWWEKFEDPTLNRLIRIALKQNYDLKVAREKICQFREQYRIVRSDLFPQVDANATAIRSKISENLVNSQFLGTQYQNFFQAGFDAFWELDFFGKIRREKEAAIYAIQAQEDEKNGTELILTADVARLYVDIRFLQKKIALFKELIKVEKELFDLYQSRFDSGIDSLITTENTYASYLNISSQLLLLDKSLKQNFYALVALLGKSPDQLKLSSLKDGPIPHIQNPMFCSIPSLLLRRRPDIRRAERLFAEATANIGVAFADFFPRFSLIGDYHQRSANLNNLFKTPSSSWNIGPTIDWPIITFGKIRANVNLQKSVQKQAFYTYKQTIINAFKDVENAFAAYFDEKQYLCNITKALESLTNKKKLKQDLFISGIDDQLQFLQAKKEALDQENLVIESDRNVSINLIAVYKALGGGF